MDTQSNDYGQQNFTLPHDVVPLPSQGIFYKNKKKSLKVGYLTASDENILMGGGNDLTLNLLRGKIYEPDIRVEDLIEGDVEAILIFLRNTSFGPEYIINLIDPSTNKTFSHTVVLDELNIKQSKNQPDENGFFTTTLPKTGVTVKLRPTTFHDTIELDKMVEQYPVGRQAPRVTWKLQKQIVEIDGDSDRGKIAMFVDTLPIMDSKYIRTFLRENEPSLDLKRTATAPSGELVSYEITFGVEFFRPFF